MVDTIRVIFTYSIATLIVVGGGTIIYQARNDPASADTVAIIAGFVGAAVTFVFSQEVQTRTARQSATATASGAAAATGTTNGH